MPHWLRSEKFYTKLEAGDLTTAVILSKQKHAKAIKERLQTTPQTCSALIIADLDYIYKREGGFIFACLLADHRMLTVKFGFEMS